MFCFLSFTWDKESFSKSANMNDGNPLSNLAKGDKRRVVECHSSVDFIGNDWNLVLFAKLDQALHVILLENGASWVGRIDEDDGACFLIDGVFEAVVVDCPILIRINSILHFALFSLPGWDRDRNICI